MLRKFFSAVLAAVLLSCSIASAGDVSRSKEFRTAVRLYGHGMYERARNIFNSFENEPLAEGYSALCAVSMKSDDCREAAELYCARCPESFLVPAIRYGLALVVFDDQEYGYALKLFSSVDEDALPRKEKAEYGFKRAYSAFRVGDYVQADRLFRTVEGRRHSDYSAPSRFLIGYIAYSDRRFAEAEEWFGKSAGDPRFSQLSDYYILECRFMLKDYGYVAGHGEEMYDSVPDNRKPHLARIISESYLVLGDAGKAMEYYEKNSDAALSGGRSDYFYAGSLMYAMQDYRGAIDNYLKMSGRDGDDIGQIANYHLGYSYIETKDKVAAMDAFRAAADASFDKAIQEDAYFNYAKLAFDLNHDASAFKEYLVKFDNPGRSDKIYGYIALACLYNHDYEGAVEAYDKIDELDGEMRGNYMKAYFLRAEQLVSGGSYRKAIPCLKAASYYSTRRDPFNQLSRYWLAESYFRDENYAEALAGFTDLYNQAALDGHTEGSLLPYDIAYCYFRSGDYADAIKWFDRYVDSGHGLYRADAETRKGDCYFNEKDFKSAVAAYEAKINEYPDADDVYPYYRAGISLGLAGDKAGKVRMLENVRGASAGAAYRSDAMYELGRAYVANGQDDEAVAVFREMAASSPDKMSKSSALIELGMISRNAGRYDEALGYYKQVVALVPASESAEAALLAIESIYQSKQAPDEYLAYLEGLGQGTDKTDEEKETMYFNTAEQVFLSENYEKTLSLLQDYMQRYPSGSHRGAAEFYMAESYKQLGRKEQARDWYRHAIDSGDGSFVELSMLNFANLSYSLEHYSDAYEAYVSLLDAAKLENNRYAAVQGMMRSAYRRHDYASAINAAAAVRREARANADDKREADYIEAKSLLATSERDKAFSILERLSRHPSTSEGAEASYMIIQDLYDRGRFDGIEDKVYAFSDSAGGQAYWLAKAFIVLGDSFMERDNVAQARATYESVLNGYEPEAGTSDDIRSQIEMRLAKIEEENK